MTQAIVPNLEPDRCIGLQLPSSPATLGMPAMDDGSCTPTLLKSTSLGKAGPDHEFTAKFCSRKETLGSWGWWNPPLQTFIDPEFF